MADERGGQLELDVGGDAVPLGELLHHPGVHAPLRDDALRRQRIGVGRRAQPLRERIEQRLLPVAGNDAQHAFAVSIPGRFPIGDRRGANPVAGSSNRQGIAPETLPLAREPIVEQGVAQCVSPAHRG